MKLQGAVIREQDVTFAIAVVQRHILNSNSEANKTIHALASIFGFVPIVLMAQDACGTPTLYGRQDIVRFLRNVPLDAIPWMEYTVS